MEHKIWKATRSTWCSSLGKFIRLPDWLTDDVADYEMQQLQLKPIYKRLAENQIRWIENWG